MVMTNILSGLPILGILPILVILHTHPFILTGTLAQLIKIPIYLDISRPLPARVKVTPSTEFPGGTHYTMKATSRHSHIIGRVRDDQDVLIEGDTTAASRHVTVVPRGDGGKYVRIITRWIITKNKYITHIDEFVKRPEDAHYRPIIRTPIELDVLTQDIDQNVHVELLGNWEEHDRRPGVMPEDIEDMPILFTIQPEVALHAMIGIVKYGDHILDDNVDGLLYREVIWEGGVDAPTIFITSKYNDGRGIEAKYKFMGEYDRFILTKIRNLILNLR